MTTSLVPSHSYAMGETDVKDLFGFHAAEIYGGGSTDERTLGIPIIFVKFEVQREKSNE